MSVKEYVCIVCPNGCLLKAELLEGELVNLQGAMCSRGVDYVKNEILTPLRTVSTSIKVVGGDLPLVSVRLDSPIPKEDVMRFINETRKIQLHAPIKIGEKVIINLWGTGVNVIATKNIKEKSA